MARTDGRVMRDLLERVKAATDGVFLLNAHIGMAIEPDYPGAWPDYTSNTDAALALIRRALPGFGGRVSFAPSGSTARLWHLNRADKIKAVDGATPALALVAALLTALIAQEATDA